MTRFLGHEVQVDASTGRMLHNQHYGMFRDYVQPQYSSVPRSPATMFSQTIPSGTPDRGQDPNAIQGSTLRESPISSDDMSSYRSSLSRSFNLDDRNVTVRRGTKDRLDDFSFTPESADRRRTVQPTSRLPDTPEGAERRETIAL